MFRALTIVVLAGGIVLGTRPAEAQAPGTPVEAASRTTPAEPAVPPSAQATAPLDRPSETSLPRWLTLNGQFRVRAEAPSGWGSADDRFLLSRFRVGVGVTVAPWAKAFVQFQDARVFGYDARQPVSMENIADIREAFVALGKPNSSWEARVGRQEVSIGDQRLVTAADWVNSARAFDGVRGGLTLAHGRLSALALAPVVPIAGAVDRRHPDERLAGAVYTYRRTAGTSAVLEPYLLVKTTRARTLTPSSTIVTYGARTTATFRHGYDYQIEAALQRGRVGADALEAAAVHGGMGRTWTAVPWSPRVGLEADYASGDRDPNDGVRGTFDQLYGTNHARFGLVDRVAWRNMRHVGVTLDLQPRQALKLRAAVRRLHINQLADGLYTTVSGPPLPVVHTPDSDRIGDAIDVIATFAVARRHSVGVGAGYLAAGRYTSVALNAGNLWAPHVTWRIAY